MWPYAAIFAGSLFVDLIPVMGPPAWIVMAFFHSRFALNLWLVLVCGVLGSTIGRVMLARLIVPRMASHLLSPSKNEDMVFLGEQLNRRGLRSWLFVLFYTLTPIPTSPLFTAAGMAKLRAWHIVPPFFVGKFISDALMVIAGKYSYENASAIAHGMVSWETIVGIVLGLLLISALLFVDWRTVISKRQFKLTFNIWK